LSVVGLAANAAILSIFRRRGRNYVTSLAPFTALAVADVLVLILTSANGIAGEVWARYRR
jgi:hypothetical protein